MRAMINCSDETAGHFHVTLSRDELSLILDSLNTYGPTDLVSKVTRHLLVCQVEMLLKERSRLRHENRDQDS